MSPPRGKRGGTDAQRELADVLEQQQATVDVVALVAVSGLDLGAVIDAIVRHARWRCAADTAVLWRVDGSDGVVEASIGDGVPARGHRAALAEIAVAARLVVGDDVVRLGAPRRLGAAIRIDGALYGLIELTRVDASPFSDRDDGAARTFAQLATIALRNARAIGELGTAREQRAENERRSSEMAREARERETATAIERARTQEQLAAALARAEATAAENVRLSGEARAARERERAANDEARRLSGETDATLERAAAIAIENERLAGEAKAALERAAHGATENARLSAEAKDVRERQAAILDVLSVVSAPATGLRSMLETVAECAARVSGATQSALWQLDGDAYRMVAWSGPAKPEAIAATQALRIRARESGGVVGRTAASGRPVQVEDVEADPAYAAQRELMQASEAPRTRAGVPLVWDGAVIGVLMVSRHEVMPFTDAELELVQVLAGRAAVAIETTRLSDELRDASESASMSAELLAALTDVAADLGPLFDAALRRALASSEADYGWIRRFDKRGTARTLAERWADPSARPAGATTPVDTQLSQRAIASRVFRERQSVQIVDARARLGVPVMSRDEVIGVIVLMRLSGQAFSDDEVARVGSFARQSAGAIASLISAV